MAKNHSSERSQLPNILSKTPSRLSCPAPAKSPDVPEPLLGKRTPGIPPACLVRSSGTPPECLVRPQHLQILLSFKSTPLAPRGISAALSGDRWLLRPHSLVSLDLAHLPHAGFVSGASQDRFGCAAGTIKPSAQWPHIEWGLHSKGAGLIPGGRRGSEGLCPVVSFKPLPPAVLLWEEGNVASALTGPPRSAPCPSCSCFTG